LSQLKVIKEHRDEFVHVQLLTNAEQTDAYYQFLRIEPESVISGALLRDLLDQAGVVVGINATACSALADQISSGKLTAGEDTHLVAQSKAPSHGQDGRLDYAIEPSPEEVFFDVESDDIIDYKNTNLIQNVIEEQLLVTVVQPTESQNGMNLMGQPIEARQGAAVKIKLGSNVVQEGFEIFSTCAGRFIREGDYLTVNPTYVIREDVGYRIGNVNFIGKVEAQRDILDDFSVFAKEGIDVGGICGAATVESDGDIFLNGGVNGKGKGFIRSQGKIEAKYLNELTAVAWGDISVAKSIMNCLVKTKGKVDAPHGNVIGGDVIALMGIDVASAGSDLGVITTLTAGQDYELKDRMKAFESQLLEIGEEIDRIDRIIGPLLADKNKLMSLPVDKKKALKGLLEQLKRYREEQSRIRIEAESLEDEVTTTSVKEIVVRKTLFSGTRVVIGNCKKVIKADIKGPIRLREDLENDTISITTISL
jgi:uncharacterized protein (DUF342 family)